MLLAAAALRLVGLTVLPQGLRDEEIAQLEIAALARSGAIAPFYNVDDPSGGREGLFAALHGWLSIPLGKGELPLRSLAVWCGVLSVALTYALGRRLFGHYAGLVAGIGMALSFYPILVGRSITSEALALPLIALALLLIADAVHLRRQIAPLPPQSAAYVSLGVVLALSAYAHWSGLFAVLLFGVFIAYLRLTRQPISRRVLGYALFSLLIGLIVAIPYIGATIRAFPISSLNRLWLSRPESVGAFVGGIGQAIGGIGIYGDALPQQNLPALPLLNPIGAVLLLIGVIEAARRFRVAPNYALPLLALMIGLLADAWTRGAPNFSHQLVALPAIMLLMGAGADAFVRLFRLGLPRPTAEWLIAIGTFAIAAASFFAAADLLFRLWASHAEVQQVYRARLGALAAYLDRTSDGLSTSICTFTIGSSSPTRPDSLLLSWMLHRHDLDLRYSNCANALVLTGGGAPQRYAFAHPEARALLPEPLAAWLQKATAIPVAGLAEGSLLRVDAEQVVADDFGQISLSQAWWAPQEREGQGERAQLPLRMGGYLTFQGYRLLPEREVYRGGETLNLVTYWRADGEQVAELRLFAHVLRNPNIAPALQNDLLNIESALLRDRDVFIQIIALPLPPDFPSGEYFLSVGAYSDRDKQRLPIYDGETPRSDRLFLRKIRVE